jgi:nucleoside-diphosphate-sugar epimerase
MVAAYAPLVGLSWAWGRSFSVYGPHEHHSRLVASVARNLVLGQAAACSAGTAVRDYLHVADMAEAFVAVLDSDLQGPVNIASGQGRPLSEIALRVADIYGRPDLLELGARPESVGEPPVLIGDILRLREIGWKPRYTLDEGLTDILAWWRRKLNVEQGR